MQWLSQRADRELRRYPAFAKVAGRIASVWDRLVGSFCEAIEPAFARFTKDLRLVAVVTHDDDIVLHEVGKNGVADLGALSLWSKASEKAIDKTKWSGIELRLRPSQVLQRTLSLPAASQDFLKPIIEHRLERLTPWRSDRVLYGYRITYAPADSAGQVTVELLAASKDVVERFSGRMTEAGLAATRIGVAEAALDQRMVTTLHVRGERPDSIVSKTMVSRIALCLIGTLFIVTIATALLASAATGDDDAMGGKLTKARMLLTRAVTANPGDREQMLLSAKSPDRTFVVLIDRLSTKIPSDTYLTDLSITPEKVHLTGISKNAPALVEALETAGLSNVRFDAAVTRDEALKDHFEVVADWLRPLAPSKDASR